jgi:hypothetical protein
VETTASRGDGAKPASISSGATLRGACDPSSGNVAEWLAVTVIVTFLVELD